MSVTMYNKMQEIVYLKQFAVLLLQTLKEKMALLLGLDTDLFVFHLVCVTCPVSSEQKTTLSSIGNYIVYPEDQLSLQ